MKTPFCDDKQLMVRIYSLISKKKCNTNSIFEILVTSLCKGSRKKKVPPLMARPLRGGGVKAGPLRKKKLFLKLFFYFVAI